MNRIIFLLAVLTFASCSRIVTKDYELLDSGTVAEIDNVEGKMGIASNRDGVCREWFPETMRDGLSVWGICYADSLAVGDKCYVYDGGDKPVISKVSVADAQRINRALLERASDIGTADCLCFNGAGDNGVLAVQSEQRQMHRCRLCADFGNDGCRGCVDGSGAQA